MSLSQARAASACFLFLSITLAQGCYSAPPVIPPKASQLSWDPWGPPQDPPTHTLSDEEGEVPGSLGEALIGLYQRFLRREAGIQSCPFSPSCSRYTRSAMARYGLLPGLMLGFDRLLIRENFDAGHHHLLHFHDGELTLHDPVP